MPVFFWLPYIILSGMMSLATGQTAPDKKGKPENDDIFDRRVTH